MRVLSALLLSAQVAIAEAPLSAIDWLSESLSQPPNFVITPPSPPNVMLSSSIFSSSLDLVSRDAAGILPPAITGFPARLWGDMPADQVILALENHKPAGVPELHSLFRNLLLAQADPPLAGEQVSPLLTRIDLLMDMGALDEAETLIKLAGVTEPEIFKQWFDVSIMANRTRAVCAALAESPDLSDDVTTRVVCLARGGDWNAAAITLSLSASIGDLEPLREELLIRFLDPDLFAHDQETVFPDPFTPVDFALREALGLPRPTPMPLMFLPADLKLNTPQRRRMEAAEQLVQSAAIPTSLLFAAYRGGRPASSGGIWERANVVQRLDRALIGDDDVALANAIQQAFEEMANVGLLPALAAEYSDALAHHPKSPDLESVSTMVQTLLLLQGIPVSAWVETNEPDSTRIEMARILASRIPVLGLSPYDDPLLNAIFAAFADQTPPLSSFSYNLDLIESGQIGAGVLVALGLLANGFDGEPANIHEGLFLLRKAGLDGAARRVAIQLLLTQMP
ncbi:MAG: hypothetical protein L3J33_03860 [Rhodobacteraceae bacterium]|nr:hypothetical protein [Paracoccaceae bacterium]